MTVQFDAVKEASDAFLKIFQRRNWLLGAPSIAGLLLAYAIIFAVLVVVMGPEIIRQIQGGSQTPNITPTQIVALVVGISFGVLLAIAVNAFTYGWTLVAAENVWIGQEPAFDRGFNRAAAKLIQLLVFNLLVGLMAVVSIITIVGPLIIGVLSIYGTPYILFGGRSATAAIGASFKLASENIGPTVIMVLAIIVVAIASFIPSFALSWIPGVGFVAQLAIQWIITAYIALLVVRFYELLSISSGEPPFPIVPQQTVG